MDRISLKNMKFFGRHGLFEAEAVLGQRFEVDLDVLLDLSKAGDSDQMEDSVHYGELYETVRQIVEAERYNLLEALCGRITKAVLDQDSRIEEAVATVRKPGVPIPGILDCAEVCFRRKRNG